MADLPGSSTRGFRVHCYEREDALVAECHGKLIFENTNVLKEEVRAKIPGHKSIPPRSSTANAMPVGGQTGAMPGCMRAIASPSSPARK